MRVLLVEDNEADADLVREAQRTLPNGPVADAGLVRSIRDALSRHQHVERTRLLGEVGAALGRSVDRDATIQQLIAVLTRDFATTCGLEGCAASEGFDEAMAARARLADARLYRDLSTASEGADQAALDALRAEGMTSAVIVRFSANGHTDGTLILGRGAGRTSYGPADQDLAEEITTRLTAALEHAGLLALARRERERAELAGQLRDDFLATLSRELRTPLSAILGWTQLLLAGDLPPEHHRNALETIERNTLSQAALIEDVLDVSRLITGKLRLQTRAVNLLSTVVAAVEAVRPAAEAKGVTIAVESSIDIDTIDPIQGDSDRLQQMLWNLLANAVRFTPRDGTLGVHVRRHDDALEVEIVDTGQGSPELLPQVLERLQDDASKARASTELGLGLAIARQLVELHGGTIHAASDGAGRGTRFVVRLPLAALNIAPATAPRSTALARAIDGGHNVAGLSVLIVDDDPDTLYMLRSVFEIAGSDVVTAASAADAFRSLQTRLPDVLVSDIGMPGATGYDLIQRLRALPSDRGRSTVAIALTAYARAEDSAEALRAGFDRHVCKPVQPKELLAIVAQLAQTSVHVA